MSVLLKKLVRVQVLSCRLAASHQEKMVQGQAEGVGSPEDCIDTHSKRNAPFGNGIAECSSVSRSPHEHVYQTSDQEVHAKKCGRHDKCEKVAIVSSTNAVVEPHTVMILRLNAVVTYTTVMGPRRSPDVAALAELGWDFHGCVSAGGRNDHDPFGGRRAYTERIIIRIRWGERV